MPLNTQPWPDFTFLNRPSQFLCDYISRIWKKIKLTFLLNIQEIGFKTKLQTPNKKSLKFDTTFFGISENVCPYFFLLITLSLTLMKKTFGITLPSRRPSAIKTFFSASDDLIFDTVSLSILCQAFYQFWGSYFEVTILVPTKLMRGNHRGLSEIK